MPVSREDKKAAARWIAAERHYLQAMEDRDAAIVRAVAQGARQTEVAVLFGLTKMRVNQIVQAERRAS
jgi:hypothetical protein